MKYFFSLFILCFSASSGFAEESQADSTQAVRPTFSMTPT